MSKITSGQRFGRLTVLEKVNQSGLTLLSVRCDCGKEKIVRAASLIFGNTKSCGCYALERRKEANTRHGARYSSIWNSWHSMKARCLNPNSNSYSQYGGRGITICERWLNSFENFFEDMGEKPTARHSLDRIDVNGNYEPANCRWATQKEQCNNRRDNTFLEFSGQRLSIADWERKLGISQKNISNRLNRLGWSVERALTEPVKKSKS